jgi:solute carrier family 25 (mitochondrial carnitine/acylcarnitine transporter), member 20/29
MKRTMTPENESSRQEAMKVLLCGGLAGIVTWASIFPLDVIKTRVQTQESFSSISRPAMREQRGLLQTPMQQERVLGSIEIMRKAYQSEGLQIFYRGLGVCSIRAFIVNAVQVSIKSPKIAIKLIFNSGRSTREL